MTVTGPKIDSRGRSYVPRKDPEHNDYVPKSIVLSDSPDIAPQADATARPNPSKTRADFREEEFARAIGQHGKFAVWRKALICPCTTTSNTGQTDFLCTRCDGSGFYYIDPVQVQAVIMSSDKNMNLYERAGAWMSGQTQITVNARHRLGYRDSIELRDALMVFDELITKGNRRGIRSALPAGVDSCRYRVVNVVHAIFENAQGAFVSLQAGTHFTRNENGWLVWTAAGESLVAKGTTISIRYEFHPTYLVESFPHAWRSDVSRRRSLVDKAIDLPVQAVGRLDYLIDPNKAFPSTWEV